MQQAEPIKIDGMSPKDKWYNYLHGTGKSEAMSGLWKHP